MSGMNISDAFNGHFDNMSDINDLVTFPSARRLAPVPTATLQQALALVDASGAAELMAAWEREDGARRASSSLPARVVLAAWVVLAMEGTPLTVQSVAVLIASRLTLTTRALLGLPDTFAYLSEQQVAGRVRRATLRVLDVMDAFPLPTRQRRLTKREWNQVCAQRGENAAQLEVKRRRFVEFANRLLAAQYETVRDHVRLDEVNVALGTRFRGAHAVGIGKRRMAELQPGDLVSAEPDAGLRADVVPGMSTLRARYGWEDDLIVLTPQDPAGAHRVPNIVIGFNTHRPGMVPARFAGEALLHMADRGTRVGHVVVNRARMSERAEHLRDPLRALGAQLVGDYPISRLGVREVAEHGVLVEGAWYHPSMPPRLRDAVKDFRSTTTPSSAYRAAARGDALGELIAERAEYMLRPKRNGVEGARAGVHVQRYPYLSPEWDRAYTSGRYAIETYLRALDCREQRAAVSGVRGATGQAFLSLLAIIGTNSRIISAHPAAHADQKA